ncbi:SRPBCC family protein [Halobacterium sp. R2-5]|uniref:SRPBCC family protein n=1 Tax=Halobacterium sp. R2-5 TaxID=2715751 RepID=UPI0014200A30|nr:SRPBCC family protein [Halobacterium sp. R2-5]NIC00425.1 cyclase [Halobacterium sp. R2-5]
MATFERELRVRAPLSEAWAFHSTEEGLLALTPAWLNLRVERIERPEGGGDSDVLTEGTRIHASVRPFGVGPRQAWVSYITEREEREDTAYFVDVMEDGPFPEWEHTHALYADGEQTLLRDRVKYRTPAGRLGDEAARFGLAPMFWYRHRRTRDILDGP